LVEETGVPRENHRPVASYCQTLSHTIASTHEIVLLHLTMGGNRIKNYRREDALKTLIDVNQTIRRSLHRRFLH
jgi:hypothetical protein